MNTLHAAVLEALKRIQQFLDVHADVLGTVNGSSARRTLDTVTTELSTHAVEQGSNTARAVGETRNFKAVRDHLRRTIMQPVIDMARAKLPDAPQVGALRLPSPEVTGVRLVAAAGALANAVEPYAAVLVESGLKPDFVQSLRTGVAQLDASLTARRAFQRRRGEATASLGTQARTARRAIRMLDAAVSQQLGDQPALLEQWKKLKRVPRKPGAVRDIAATPTAGPGTVSPQTTAAT